MTEENTELKKATLQPADEGRRKKISSHQKVREVIDSATDYIRTHPWVSVTAATLIGGILTAICYDKSKSIRSCKSGHLRDWLEGACSKAAAKKRMDFSAIPADLGTFLNQIKSKIHMPQ